MSFSETFRTIRRRLHNHASTDIPPALGWEALSMEAVLRPQPERPAKSWLRLGYHLAALALLLVRCGPGMGEEVAVGVFVEGGHGVLERQARAVADGVTVEDCLLVKKEESSPDASPPVSRDETGVMDEAGAAGGSASAQVAVLPVDKIQELAGVLPAIAINRASVFPKGLNRLADRRIDAVTYPEEKEKEPSFREEVRLANERPSSIGLAFGTVRYLVSAPEGEQATLRSPAFGPAVNAFYNTSTNEGFGVRIGVGYQQFRHVSTASGNWRANVYQPGTVDTLFRNIDEGTETVSTVDSVSAAYAFRFRNTNKFGLGRVSAGLTASTGGRKFRLLAGGGISANFRVSAAGREVLAVPESEAITPAQDRFSFGFYGSVGLRYEVREGLAVEVLASGQYTARNLIESRLDGREFRAYGVQIGVVRALR